MPAWQVFYQPEQEEEGGGGREQSGGMGDRLENHGIIIIIRNEYLLGFEPTTHW